jgi:hypothetical protein
MTKRKLFFAVAPGGNAERHAMGADSVVYVEHDGGPGDFIVGMRALAPGPSTPGTRADYDCEVCRERVRLAPSGQRVARRGAIVICLECATAILPREGQA